MPPLLVDGKAPWCLEPGQTPAMLVNFVDSRWYSRILVLDGAHPGLTGEYRGLDSDNSRQFRAILDNSGQTAGICEHRNA